MSLTLALMLAAQTVAATSDPKTATPPDPAARSGREEGRLGTAQQGGGDVVVTARRRAETIQSVPIAMSVIGGTALSGGRFSIAASLIGALIIQALNTGILISGFPPEFNLIIKAVVIIVILALQSPVVANSLAAATRARASPALPRDAPPSWKKAMEAFQKAKGS